MNKPLTVDADIPLSRRLGDCSFSPAPDNDIENLRQEIQELKSRISALEAKQQRLPWWRRLVSRRR